MSHATRTSGFEGQVINDPDSDEREYFSVKCKPTSTVLPLINKLDRAPPCAITARLTTAARAVDAKESQVDDFET